MKSKKSQSAAQKSSDEILKPEHDEKEEYVRSRVRKIWHPTFLLFIRDHFIIIKEIPIDIKFIGRRRLRDMEYTCIVDVSCRYSFLSWIFLNSE